METEMESLEEHRKQSGYAECYLLTFNFNQLLDAIADDHVTVVVIVTNIT